MPAARAGIRAATLAAPCTGIGAGALAGTRAATIAAGSINVSVNVSVRSKPFKGLEILNFQCFYLHLIAFTKRVESLSHFVLFICSKLHHGHSPPFLRLC